MTANLQVIRKGKELKCIWIIYLGWCGRICHQWCQYIINHMKNLQKKIHNSISKIDN